jgi:hypothetical protein
MIKIKKILLIAFCCSFLLLSSCYYDVQEELHPGISSQVCDTTNITYAVSISTIMDNNCNSCHSTAAASGNAILDNYADLRIVALNGRLEGAIEHLSGFAAMPQNVPMLSQCDRLTIKKWIENGITNN